MDLREFAEFPARKRIEGNPSEFKLDYDSIEGVRQILADLSIQRSGEEYFCRGEISATMTLECARCLGTFEVKVVADVDFIACSRSHYDSFRSEAVDSEDYVLFDGMNLVCDITDQVRQALLLCVDMKPLCSEDCRGLCSVCGANLNNGDCNCERKETDPRWSELADLKKKMFSNNKE
ncbi:MAG TPA: DUF177 domain-containing protein [candidate division Zixibacteria bacterium]|nr:DUF177 domain-containing protein [candidate division Zixibacteria bacterium]